MIFELVSDATVVDEYLMNPTWNKDLKIKILDHIVCVTVVVFVSSLLKVFDP